MSLSAALSASVSALNAQSLALATVSNNLANANTTAYKSSDTTFESLVNGSGSTASGGVIASTYTNVKAQGLMLGTSTATNMAIDGAGFFVVRSSSDTSGVSYSRNGAFTIDEDGYLANNGYYLMGWPTDADGTVIGSATEAALQPIDTALFATSAAPTTSAALSANLPAEAATSDTFTSSMEVYDSLGTAASVGITWARTGANTWSASFANPVATDGSTVLGAVTSGTVSITFNDDGTFASATPTTLSISGWTSGAANSTIALDFGTPGGATGLTQYTSGAATPSVELEFDQDGVGFGSLESITIGDDGTVQAAYDNGQTRSIYKIAVATFPNPDGLTAKSGGIYAASQDSGLATLRQSGSGGAGTIRGSTLEASTTDTNEEFSTMMSAQQAYSAAAQVMTAVNTMYETLINAVR